MDFLSAQELFRKKTRINVYLPKRIVEVLDDMAGKLSRGDMISRLVLKEASSMGSLPYGIFSGLEISEDEIKTVTKQWGGAINDKLLR